MTYPRSHRNGRARGFTLIEIMVVVAIIGTLVGLLLPVLANARAAAKRTQCLSNLHQIYLACELYVNNHMGSYPPAYGRYTRDGQKINGAWDYSTVVGSPGTVLPGTVFEGQSVDRVLQCPCFKGTANWANDPHSGYNYNTSYIGHGENEAIPAPAQATDVEKPGSTALFGDGEYISGANKFMRAPFPNPGDVSFNGRYAGTQGFRHQGKTNVVFCDGHAESIETRCTESTAMDKSKIAPGTGFLSNDNSMYETSK